MIISTPTLSARSIVPPPAPWDSAVMRSGFVNSSQSSGQRGASVACFGEYA